MGITATNWKNKKGTANRDCKCGTWKQHWINNSGKTWPSTCSVSECSSSATLGGHIIHSDISGEKIIPMCDSCNKLIDIFNLKVGITVVSANKSQTCEQ